METTKIKKLECLKDLEHEDVVILDTGNESALELTVYWGKSRERSIGSRELEFMKHCVTESGKFVHSLYVDEDNLEVRSGIIRIINPRHQGFVNWFEEGLYLWGREEVSPLNYSERKGVITRSGVEGLGYARREDIINRLGIKTNLGLETWEKE